MTNIECPLIDGMIEIGDCVVCSDVARGVLKETLVPGELKKKDNWRNVCLKCKYNEM